MTWTHGEHRGLILSLGEGMNMKKLLWLIACVTLPAHGAEPLKAETYFTATLPKPTPHWVFVNDMNFLGYVDGKVYLIDAGAGKMLGMMSTGTYQMAIEIAPDVSAVYVPVTFYSRGTHGERTDAVVIYETEGLTPVAEVVIPPKRATGMPMRGYSGMSDDGRFVYVANMTPASSFSVVDVVARKFLGEIESAGCALIFPTGNRSLASLCGDGTVQTFVVDEVGAVTARAKSAPFFDPNVDPVTEKASRRGNTWYFFSFEGYVHPVAFEGGTANPQPKWSLFTDEERNDGWRVGGSQFNAIHEANGRLYVVVHQGETDSHKDPGMNVWVYDLATRAKVDVIDLESHAVSVAVTQDAEPLLVTNTLELPVIHVYDATSGALVNVIEGGPMTPSFPQVP